jgi:hypothetical protein
MWLYLPKDADIIELLIGYGLNILPSINKLAKGAIACGSLNILKLLIKEGADIHMDNDELLIYASGFRRIEIIDFLLDCGIDICTRNNSVLNFFEFDRKKVIKEIFNNEMWRGPDTPSLDIFKYLLKKGAVITNPVNLFMSYILDSSNLIDDELFLLFLDGGLDIDIANWTFSRPDIMKVLEKYKND